MDDKKIKADNILFLKNFEKKLTKQNLGIFSHFQQKNCSFILFLKVKKRKKYFK